jgi:hypothetical protein
MPPGGVSRERLSSLAQPTWAGLPPRRRLPKPHAPARILANLCRSLSPRAPTRYPDDPLILAGSRGELRRVRWNWGGSPSAPRSLESPPDEGNLRAFFDLSFSYSPSVPASCRKVNRKCS